MTKEKANKQNLNSSQSKARVRDKHRTTPLTLSINVSPQQAVRRNIQFMTSKSKTSLGGKLKRKVFKSKILDE